MESFVLQLIFIYGILYGLVTLFVALKYKPKRNKYQIGISIAIIIACGSALLIMMN